MKFAVYLPAKAESEPVPVLYYLSGLTCTEQNVITKVGWLLPLVTVEDGWV
jgi:S-formylglutathione hydrolase